jgi:hypothetical protein
VGLNQSFNIIDLCLRPHHAESRCKKLAQIPNYGGLQATGYYELEDEGIARTVVANLAENTCRNT